MMKISQSYIFIQGIRLYAFHGVGALEKTVGQNFIVDIKLKTNISKACESDDLTDTVNYAAVYDIIRQEMEKPSLLLEHVGQRIANHLLEYFPLVDSIWLKITKQNPPMGADCLGAGIEMTCER